MSLGYNELDQGSVMAVAEAVANKTELKKLDLNGERRTHSMGGSSLAFTLPPFLR